MFRTSNTVRATILALGVVASLSASALAVGAARAEDAQAPVAATAAQPKNQTALQGVINDLMQGQTELAQVTPRLRVVLDQQTGLMPSLVVRLKTLGSLESLAFVGVEKGLEVYEAHFAKGTVGWAIGVDGDGKVAALRWKFS